MIFGFKFKDLQEHKKCDGYIQYKSPSLARIWGKGFCTIGECNLTTAGYCAKYTVKKITGEKQEEHYQHIDPDTGEQFKLAPEFALMSRKPGIGYKWLQRYRKDCAKGFITTPNGKKAPIPKYYRRLLEEWDEQRENGPYGLKERLRQKIDHSKKDGPTRGAQKEEAIKHSDKRHKGTL